VNFAVEALVVAKTHRVPIPVTPAGDAAAAVRQFDAAAMTAGFKLSRGLIDQLAMLDAGAVTGLAARVLDVVRREAGDHVQHNAYFRDFPAGVPDTLEFWVDCLRDALLDPVAARAAEADLSAGVLNLLTLPKYGRYQHTYAELLAAHDELIPAAGDRLTILLPGGSLADEARALYLDLAASRIPLSEADLAALAELAAWSTGGPQPAEIPVRESKAVINAAWLAAGRPLLADTVTDILRAASLDRLLRAADGGPAVAEIVAAAVKAAPGVSGRVLLSVREHLQNRAAATDVSRVFANRDGRAWVTADGRPPLDAAVVTDLLAVLDDAVAQRLPAVTGALLIDPAVRRIALPLSGASAPGGLGVMPRGSVWPVTGDTLRFFTYWRQHAQVTDFDLSAVLLDRAYQAQDYVSYTSLRAGGGVHSGDITEAPDGASEFIDVDLAQVSAQFIVPQVNVFSGEGFGQVDESFFGFMTRDAAQLGQPYEPRTVRMKADLRGAGRVALPLAFMRGDDGRWRAKWLNLYLRGEPRFNRIEENKVSASLLARAIIERDYLRVDYLTGLLARRGADVLVLGQDPVPAAPVTFIGLDRPDGLADGSVAYTLQNLSDLIPA
jgi:stress response protein SCP2